MINYISEGHGIPAIVIGSCKYYPRTFSAGLRKYFNLIFMDTRAFGGFDEPFSLSDIIGDIEQLRQTLKLDKIVIIGHSIHAFMALEYSKRYTDAVIATVMIAASPITGDNLHQEANKYFTGNASAERKEKLSINLKEMDAAISTNPDNSFITRMLRFAPMIWYDYNYDAEWLWQDVDLSPVGASIVWGGMFNNYDIIKDLNKLKTPVLLLLGRYDYWNPPYLWDNIQHSFDNIKIRIFEQSGHTPQFEEPESFDKELIDILVHSNPYHRTGV